MPNKIKFHIDENNVAVLRLNDPERLNALSLEMLTEIHEQIKLINTGKTNARCLVITGEGRGFCAGANLIDTNAAPSESDNPMDRDLGKGLLTHYHPMLIDLKNLEIPIITAIKETKTLIVIISSRKIYPRITPKIGIKYETCD